MRKNTFLINPAYAHLMQKDDRIIVRETTDRDPAIMEPFANIAGVNFVIDDWAPKSMRVQFRKPKSKKARIRKKWAKDPRNWKDVNVMWLVDPSKIMRVTVPNAEIPYWRTNHEALVGLERAARAIYGFKGV